MNIRFRSIAVTLLGLCLTSCSNPEKLQDSLLHAAAEGDIVKVKQLIAKGARLNEMCPPNYICQPLPYASENGDLSMMQLLIDEGADVNGRNAYDDSPLIYALTKQQKEAVKLLVKSGADVNQPNAFGTTPFMGVCAEGNIELVDLFVQYGAKPNLQFEDRTSSSTKQPGGGKVTALMMAAQANHVEVVKRLLNLGADKSIKDTEGLTARDYAIKGNAAEVEQLLR